MTVSPFLFATSPALPGRHRPPHETRDRPGRILTGRHDHGGEEHEHAAQQDGEQDREAPVGVGGQRRATRHALLLVNLVVTQEQIYRVLQQVRSGQIRPSQPGSCPGTGRSSPATGQVSSDQLRPGPHGSCPGTGRSSPATGQVRSCSPASCPGTGLSNPTTGQVKSDPPSLTTGQVLSCPRPDGYPGTGRWIPASSQVVVAQ